jgi:FKBP-type peptidyl-prolyl cis-trans isomerase 2
MIRLPGVRLAAGVLYFAFLLGMSSGLRAAEDNGIRAGDKIGVRFTCRLNNGQVASSTYADLAKDSSAVKSPVFLARTIDDPITVTAGEAVEDSKEVKLLAFEDAIALQLARVAPGMHFGESRTVEITAEPQPGLSARDRYVRLALVRQRPKEMKMTRDEYTGQTGKEPAAGDGYVVDPLAPGKVDSINGDEIVIRFLIRPGSEMETPFGKATVRETEKNYEIVIRPTIGTLVRTMGLVGRITEVGERTFTVDYGNPLGGEKLMCDVTVTPETFSQAANKE